VSSIRRRSPAPSSALLAGCGACTFFYFVAPVRVLPIGSAFSGSSTSSPSARIGIESFSFFVADDDPKQTVPVPEEPASRSFNPFLRPTQDARHFFFPSL